MWGGAFPHRVPDAPRPVSEPDAQAPARSEQQRSPTHDRVQGHLRSRDTGPGFPWLPTEAGGFQRAVWLRVVDWRRADTAARMARPPRGPTRPARSAIGASPGGPALCPSRPPRHAVPSVSNAFPRCAPARPRLPSGHRLHVTGADGRPLAGSPPAPRGRTCPATRPAAPRYAPILSKTPVCGPGPRA